MPIQYRPFVGPPGGRRSSLSSLIVSPERAEYIQTKLWPEYEMRGRPGILASDQSSHFASELRADRRLSGIDFPPAAEDSVAADSDSGFTRGRLNGWARTLCLLCRAGQTGRAARDGISVAFFTDSSE